MNITRIKKQLVISLLCFATLPASAAELTVSAAASLNNAFNEIAKNFETRHPDDKILFNFAASGALLQQIAKGAPVDVFASADQETMDQAQQQNLLQPDTRQNFTSNTLVLIIPTASTQNIAALTDLDKADVKRIAVGAPASVPVGRYTQEALQKSGQWDSLQDKYVFSQNVRQALDYVARGEVDAGFVYDSDAAIMKDKVRVQLTVPLTTPVSYPIAQIKDTPHQALAAEFINYVLSAEGQQILAKYGFQPQNAGK